MAREVYGGAEVSDSPESDISAIACFSLCLLFASLREELGTESDSERLKENPEGWNGEKGREWTVILL